MERETQRNVELMWLNGRLMPDFKTIANFRKDNGPAIRGVCRQFIVLCRQLNLFTQAVVAVDDVLNLDVKAFAVPRAGWAEAFEQFCRATIKVRIPDNQDEKVLGAWAEGRA